MRRARRPPSAACTRKLDTNAPYLTWLQFRQQSAQLRHQRTEKLVLGASGNENDDGYRELRNVLLVAEALVGRDEYVELAGRRSKEGAIVQ